MIRRLIEQIINQKLVSDEDCLNTYIDNEAMNDDNQANHLIKYINQYWNTSKRGKYVKHLEYAPFIPTCNATIKIKYLDSKTERLIQLADVTANAKYKRFSGKKGCHSNYLKTTSCLKLPKTFFSPKSLVYNM
ncbi:DUF3800 domain-containing protein [Staphylococcus cohnii]